MCNVRCIIFPRRVLSNSPLISDSTADAEACLRTMQIICMELFKMVNLRDFEIILMK